MTILALSATLGLRRTGRLRVALLLGAVPAFLPAPVLACLVCITLPERTIADRVIEAETVVLAREDPARPFSYAPVEPLKGDVSADPIPFLVDSTMRRRLTADRDATVLFVREAESWVQLAYVDAPVRAMLDQILAAAPAWEAEPDHAQRFTFFADLHDHANDTIRLLALAEISRAPYAQIRSMTPRLSRPQIARILRDPKWAEWAPVHILFLGLSDDPEDHAFVRRMTRVAAERGIQSNLGAWATALVEIDGLPAIDWLRTAYLEDPSRAVEALRAVIDALATLLDGGDPDLQPAIAAVLRDLPRRRPDLAPEAAVQLAALGDWSQAETFSDILESGAVPSPAAEFVIMAYLEAARGARRNGPRP
jgi:hypothetical protein